MDDKVIDREGAVLCPPCVGRMLFITRHIVLRSTRAEDDA